jgi:hypothetical protein
MVCSGQTWGSTTVPSEIKLTACCCFGIVEDNRSRRAVSLLQLSSNLAWLASSPMIELPCEPVVHEPV